jgi:hypothetical protein
MVLCMNFIDYIFRNISKIRFIKYFLRHLLIEIFNILGKSNYKVEES